jgi:hypothetical protein
MKAIVAAVISGVLLCGSIALAQQPRTVDEAVQVLKAKWLKPKDLEWILRNPKEQVVWTCIAHSGLEYEMSLASGAGTSNSETPAEITIQRAAPL